MKYDHWTRIGLKFAQKADLPLLEMLGTYEVELFIGLLLEILLEQR